MPRKASYKRKVAPNYFGSDTDPAGNERPTKQEWDKMERAGAYMNILHTYHKGCDVIMCSDDTDNVWVGQVLSLRRRQTRDGIEGWAEVRWYYSQSDIEAARIGGLNSDFLSPRERVLSDHLDLVRLDTFKRPIKVHVWNEEDIEPPELTEKSYFRRHTMKDSLSALPKILPFPGQFTCICNIPYDPFPNHLDLCSRALDVYYRSNDGKSPTRTELGADYMHFCPRPKCSKWFHEACLLHHAKSNAQNAEFIGSPAVRRLAVDPDKSILHPRLARFTYQRPGRGKHALDLNHPLSPQDVLTQALGPDAELTLPASLIAIASLPIVRRAGEGTSSIAGNMRDILLARRLVFQELEGGFEDLERLESALDEGWVHTETLQTSVWRFLGTQRILAVPRVAYWDQALQRMTVLLERPTLHCPDCSGEFPVAI
ncbi:BAH domain-containing protein [Phanerochaete sordida]|uniref:BAH domain-containing protein n=1 Tax=Phanerochaete sordida TaxID=48140 RepID=A0A9P3LF98_9APHY|nr:BAH domain-containing protein [Phanerochaete sordida]